MSARRLEVMSLRVFAFNFGASFGTWSRTVSVSRQSQFQAQKLPTSHPETDRPAVRNWAPKLPHSDPKPPAADPKLEPRNYRHPSQTYDYHEQPGVYTVLRQDWSRRPFLCRHGDGGGIHNRTSCSTWIHNDSRSQRNTAGPPKETEAP